MAYNFLKRGAVALIAPLFFVACGGKSHVQEAQEKHADIMEQFRAQGVVVDKIQIGHLRDMEEGNYQLSNVPTDSGRKLECTLRVVNGSYQSYELSCH